jgi:hypothetical protein
MVLLVRERLERPGLVRLRRQLVSGAEARAVTRRSRDFATTQARPAIVIRNQMPLLAQWLMRNLSSCWSPK